MKKNDKNEMKGLLGNLMGQRPVQQTTPASETGGPDISQKEMERYGISADIANRMSAARRIQESLPKEKKPAYVRATFLVSPTAAATIREIARREGRLIKDVANEALIRYAAAYFAADDGKSKHE